ncbi:MAG: trypsin-like peptidase domain-containing protein, partial [Oscillospiraceae bacterium]|jgi:S1-C subfamily serine protease|nr:trypsin-like peptidase domain-containing protein [Oscillospiraceae bacterium]
VLCIAILFALLGQSVFAASAANFKKTRTYKAGTFPDVSSGSWYYKAVVGGYEYGYFDGTVGGKFNPGGNITVAELVKVAALLRSAYYNDNAQFPAGDTWYRPYTDYAVKNGIITDGEFASLTARATRADAAKIIAAALPEEAYAPINGVPDNSIPDIGMGYTYSDAVYLLYRAGILAGKDGAGRFYPNYSVTRAEAAAMVLRMAEVSARVKTPERTTGEDVFAKCAPAVFLIEVFAKDGTLLKSGSGFFISVDGMAVTNCHVIANAYSANIILNNGKTTRVAGIYGMDQQTDLAIIQVISLEGRGYPYLQMRDSNTVRTGEEIYTISSQLAYLNSITKGIVSMAKRVVEEQTYIQLDAAIASGSSGGALLDANGNVIGVVTGKIAAGESFNLAVPINDLKRISTDKFAALPEFMKALPYYEGFFPAPDFGKYSSRSPIRTDISAFYALYYYASLPEASKDSVIAGYVKLLEQNRYEFYAEWEYDLGYEFDDEEYIDPDEIGDDYDYGDGYDYPGAIKVEYYNIRAYVNPYYQSYVIFGEMVKNGVREFFVEVA